MNDKEKALFEYLRDVAWQMHDQLQKIDPDDYVFYGDALVEIDRRYEKVKKASVRKPKEPTLFKICLLIGSDAGEIVDVKMEEEKELYFYDADHRWTYITKDQEGVTWERHEKRQKHDPSKFKDMDYREWVKCEDGLVRWFPLEEIKEPKRR